MRWVGGGMRSQGSRCRDGAESGSHGRAAQPLVEKARALAASDSELVVRVRAAEFLGLRQAADPRPIILDALGRTESGVEAALILNTVVLLRDGKPSYDCEITAEHLKKAVRDFPQVTRHRVSEG